MNAKLFHNEQQGINNLVFENRHKQYGAYELRTHYEDRLSAALFASLSFFMLFFGAYYYFNRSEIPPFTINCGFPCKPEIPKDDIIYIEKPPIVFSDPVAKGTVIPKVVKDHIRDNKKILPFTGGSGDTSGIEGPGGLINFHVGDFGDVVLPKDDIIKPKTDEFIIFFDEAPEFMGGMQAYEKFLQQHIKYSEMAIQNNIQGTIFVNAKIDAQGHVVGVELLKGIGGGCDEEAMRVIKNMPAWKPGKMNGKPVAVKCILKVRMLLN